MEALKRLLVAVVILAVGFAIAWRFRIQPENQEVASVDIPTVTFNEQPDEASTAEQNDRPQGVPLPVPFDPRPKLVIAPRVNPAPALSEPEMPKYYQPIRVAPSVLPPALVKVLEAPPSQQLVPRRPATGREFTNASGSVHTRIAAPSPASTLGSSRPVNRPVELREHTIVNGDTLSRIAKRFLGNADRRREIYELNRDVLRDPDVLPIGQTIKLPPRDHDRRRPRAVTDTTRNALPVLKLVPVYPVQSPQF